MRNWKRTVLAVVIFLVVVAPAGQTVAFEETAPQQPTMPVGKVYEIIVKQDSFAFAPQTGTIKLGDLVRWVNHDTRTHLVVSQDPQGSSRELLVYHRLPPGESFEFQYQHPDTYYFYCAIHFQMWGTVNVTP